MNNLEESLNSNIAGRALTESVSDWAKPVKQSPTSLNISIVTSPSGWGGMEVHTVELAQALENRGHNVFIDEVGGSFYKRKPTQRPNLHAGHRQLRDPGFLESLEVLRVLEGDVCIYPKGSLYEGSWRFDLAARLVFSRYITIEHLSCPMPPKSSTRYLKGLIPGLGLWWYKKLFGNFLRSLWPHKVICVSNAVGDTLKKAYFFPNRKIKIIHNGIDTEKFRPDHTSKTAIRKKLGIPEDSLVFGSIGRLEKIKGIETAVELFRELSSRYRDRTFWLVLVGKGSERTNLVEMARHKDIKGKVKFLDFTDRPWEIYPALDFYLMPSRSEGLPLALLEAMACGCCPIAMGVGGIPEIITTPQLGWLVKPDDKEGFFKAMNDAVTLEFDDICKMSEKARRHIVLNFCAKNKFSELVDFIEESCMLPETVRCKQSARV